MSELPAPRILRPVPDRLGLFIRVGYNDHPGIAAAIAAGKRNFQGIVVDAHRAGRNRELIDVATKARLQRVLDPCTHAAATVGGFSASLAALPWGSQNPHQAGDFLGDALKKKTRDIAEFAIENGFSHVMAPTHYWNSASSPWHAIDLDSAHQLRNALDAAGREDIGIIFPVVMSYSALRHDDERLPLIDGLETLPIDALWLRVDPFGSDSTGTGVRNFVEAAADFHAVGVPLIADQVGGLVGLSLLATSAVWGLSHGVTLKERFDAGAWRNPRSGRGFMPSHRAYFPMLDMFFEIAETQRIFAASDRLKGHFGCSDPSCCPRGVIDMLESPGNHFLTQRMRQVTELAAIPESLRAHKFLDQFMRPTADHVVRFAKSRALNEEQRARMDRHRKRLDLLRLSLDDLISSMSTRTVSPRPVMRPPLEIRLPR